MSNTRYKGLRLIPSKAAMNELMKLGFTLEDCKHILENGYDAPRKRSVDSEEKWFDKGKKTYNVVIAKSFNFMYNEEVYLIIHAGAFGKRRR